MSYDTYVYIFERIFPDDSWAHVVSEYGLLKNPLENFWISAHGDEPIKVTVEKLDRTHLYSEKFNWKISVHKSGVKSTLGFWGLVALPYYCMMYFDGAVFYDGRGDIWIESLEELERYAKPYLLQFTSLSKLSKLGLLNQQEEIMLLK